MFTPDEQAQLRMYLGYPDIYRYKDPRLESLISADVMSMYTENLVRGHLTNLVTVDAFILNNGIAAAGVKRADDIEFFKNASRDELMEFGRMYVGRISNTLGVPIGNDYFGTEGYGGDSYSGFGGGGNGARVFRLG